MSKAEIIVNFNSLFLQLFEQIGDVLEGVNDKKSIEILTMKGLIEKYVSINSIGLIEQFCAHVLQYKNKIENKAINFMNNINPTELNTKHKGDSKSLEYIKKIEDLLHILSDDNVSCVFDYLLALCEEAESYFKLFIMEK